MKKIVCIIMLLALTLNLAGCNSKQDEALVQEEIEEESALDEDQKYEIALVMKTLTNPFFIEMEKGAREAADDLGVELLVKTGAKETSIEQQIQIVEELIKKQIDAIVIAPASSTDLVKVLKKAQNQGVKIVNIDNQLDEETCEQLELADIPFISVQNDEAAYMAVKYICDAEDNTTQKDAVIIEGMREADNAQLRKSGAEKAFKEYSNIRIVASETANWKIDEAYELAKTIFIKYPETSLVFCANDMMALGFVNYIKESHMSHIKIAGFDNLKDAQQAIKEGWMYSTIDQQAELQGYKGVETAVKLINGESVEDVVYVPVKLINKEALTE